jgi:hypothetical protein
MGLDQYLSKKTYVKQWEHTPSDKLYTVDVKRGEGGWTSIKSNRISNVIEEVMYWRKANHIHHWFVQNVQDGVDDCGEYVVSPEQLQRLVQDCKEVLEDVDKGGDILPTVGGFFFGSTDYDEYYIEGIKETLNVLEPLLTEIEEANEVGEWFDIYYTSSW